MENAKPHFIIAGTQKGGTTWLEQNLDKHPDVFTPRRQIHYFDQNYDRGLRWYLDHFSRARPGQIVGEKTTEYLDILHGETVASRICDCFDKVKLIFVLRNPVERCFSALQHMVQSGLEPIPEDPDAALFDDMKKPAGKGYRYIERGLYAAQLSAFQKYFPADQMLVLLLEDDVQNAPDACWRRTCSFLGVAPVSVKGLERPVNRVRLSRNAIVMSRMLYSVPHARGIIRRLDGIFPGTAWKPVFSDDTRDRLSEFYKNDTLELQRMLGRKITGWNLND